MTLALFKDFDEKILSNHFFLKSKKTVSARPPLSTSLPSPSKNSFLQDRTCLYKSRCTELHCSSVASAEWRPPGLEERADGPSSCDLPKLSVRPWDPRTVLDHCGCPDPYHRVMLVRIPFPYTTPLKSPGLSTHLDWLCRFYVLLLHKGAIKAVANQEITRIKMGWPPDLSLHKTTQRCSCRAGRVTGADWAWQILLVLYQSEKEQH